MIPPLAPLPEEERSWLGVRLVESLATATDTPSDAAIAAGRLLRSMRLDAAARDLLAAWLCRVEWSEPAETVVESAGGSLAWGLELLARFAATRPSYRQAWPSLIAGPIPPEAVSQGACKAADWPWRLLVLRDDLESLRVSVGFTRSAAAPAAILHHRINEFDRHVEALDGVAAAYVEPLARLLRESDPIPGLEWLGELAVGEPHCWWLRLAEPLLAVEPMSGPERRQLRRVLG